jgi:hypothetical protein
MKKATTKTTAKKAPARKKAPAIEKEAVAATAAPLMVADLLQTKASSRRNVAGVIDRTDKYKNIEDGLVPFSDGSNTVGGPNAISVKDAVELCQKAYYNFAIFRNIIDLMTEFSVGELYFKNGTQKSREFFKAYFRKINLWALQDQFFREYFRSGNVFLYRFNTKLQKADVSKITTVFGASKSSNSIAAEEFEVPIKFIVLNPADIRLEGNVNFLDGSYFKTLNGYEISRLKNPQTDEDREFLDSLPSEVKTAIKSMKSAGTIVFPLDTNNAVCVFYKKQDYEPFAVPMGYPVLADINAKDEMKKIDMAVARTMQQAILLITQGTEPEKGGVSKKNLDALQTLFENQSVGRVLIADYTTKAEFVIPEIATLLDPKKYEVLDRDINIGLNNVFAGGEKFANQKQKVDVFVARLTHARESFINDFLAGEIKRISKVLGFRSYPTPCFEDINVDDQGVKAKIYTRMGEVGMLTPEEIIKAIETGELPDNNSSIDSQKKYKDHKKMGLYEPINSGGGGSPAGQPGRPDGTKNIPQSTDTVGPIGTGSQEAAAYSATGVKEAFLKASILEKAVAKAYRKINKVRKLQAADDLFIDSVTKSIIANEEMENWNNVIEGYIADPTDRNKERLNKIYEIGASHSLDFYLSSILLAARVKQDDE